MVNLVKYLAQYTDDNEEVILDWILCEDEELDNFLSSLAGMETRLEELIEWRGTTPYCGESVAEAVVVFLESREEFDTSNMLYVPMTSYLNNILESCGHLPELEDANGYYYPDPEGEAVERAINYWAEEGFGDLEVSQLS